MPRTQQCTRCSVTYATSRREHNKISMELLLGTFEMPACQLPAAAPYNTTHTCMLQGKRNTKQRSHDADQGMPPDADSITPSPGGHYYVNLANHSAHAQHAPHAQLGQHGDR